MKNLIINEGVMTLNNISLKLSETWMERFNALAIEAIMEDLNPMEKVKAEKAPSIEKSTPRTKKTRGGRGGITPTERQKFIASQYRKGIKQVDIVKAVIEKFGITRKVADAAVCDWKRLVGFLPSSNELAKYLAQSDYKIKESDLEEVSTRFGFENTKDLQDRIFYIRQLSGIDLV